MSELKVIQYDYSGAKLPGVEARSVDLAFADPPYNIGVRYDGDTFGDRMEPERYQRLMRNVIDQLSDACRPGATLWWVCPEVDADWLGPMLTETFGPRLYRIVWHETFSQYNRHNLTQDYRFIFCHHKPVDIASDLSQRGRNPITFNPDAIRVPSKRMQMGDKRAAGPRIPGRVWQLRRLQGTATARVDWHPAQMPPEVLERIVLGWSNPGDTVLDAFAGSGSLGVKCIEHERGFIGVDQSEEYCQRMMGRLDECSKALNT